MKSPFRICILLFVLTLTLQGCYTIFASTDDEDREPRRERNRTTSTIQGNFQPDPQVAPPDDIKSLQFYLKEDRSSTPVLNLKDGDAYLTLRFDKLGTRSQMFRIRITHYNSDWQRSNLSRSFYLRGFQQTEIAGSRASSVQNPAYQHYHYTFPDGFSFEYSGNYMLEVYSYEGDELLFSLPFFVTEEVGNIQTRIEQLYAGAGAHRLSHQLFTTFDYPDFVRVPEANLSIYFTQNQFWGRSRKATMPDFSEADRIRTYIPRDLSFPGRYEFRELDLRTLQPDGRNIVEYRPEMIPPRIYMFRDVVNLDVQPYNRTSHRFGQHFSDRDAKYLDVHFELQIPDELRTEYPVYVIGPFNNWQIREAHRMQYDEQDDRYRGSALMKQGVYDYKYVVKTDDGINDLRLDAAFFDGMQEYHTKVYYRDPQQQADRLLKVDRNIIRGR